MGSQPESKLSRAIISAIRAGGGYAVKIHGGPMQENGTPDILACIPVRIDEAIPDGIGLATQERITGIFVGIETKTPTGGDPSPIQAHRHAQIGAAYGQVIVPRSVQDAVQALEAMGWSRTPRDPS